MKKLLRLSILALGLFSCAQKQQISTTAFPLKIADIDPNRPMSSAMKRAFKHYEAPRLLDNELYTNFRYTALKGFDYNNGNGTISRRDPSKIIFENGQYYVWYTHRETPLPPQGKGNANDTLPSTDWDLAEIWYATSKDGFTWEEQGVAVPRPSKPQPGWRSVATADILKFKGKYYLYYQAFNAPSGTYDQDKDAYDICPVALSAADTPDGPWKAVNKVVIPFGESNEWDWRVIHDPMPLVHDGKIYLYYKSGMDQRDANRKHWDCWGLAIAEHPEGPFIKHPLSPVMNSGHETMLFPFREGVAAIVGTDGIEHNTIQYAQDWVNFEIASVTQLLPTAGGLYSPDAFTDSKNADGITWGLSHFINAGNNWKKQYSKLGRFDCDLSQSVNDPSMKKSNVLMPNDLYFRYGLSKKQRDRIEKENQKKLMNQ
ncbi:family 43 glycosylhydrolase [Flammeovirga sp. SJP92]|uniref:glycoside hydrolase family 117 protein n=1 Tax=Flammeovirga sp. SJP92 TaxID=1775430 RepID=UPI00078945BD|nr:family 43 glycosylhydrolase [Flammeovirga sp. SJP92]KXX69802.1 glycoside hydrolase [Flammeovirga sp. SJP92]